MYLIFANLSDNSTRVRLSGTELGTDYINASSIECHGRAYIAAQAPLPPTTQDFYRMIWEFLSPVIVCLSPWEESGKAKAFNYLPSFTKSIVFKKFPLEIELIKEDTSNPHFACRTLNIRRVDVDDNMTVYHFQYHNWLEHGTPEKDNFMQFVAKVHEVAAKKSQRPITVHCSGGISQTGLFILLRWVSWMYVLTS